MSWENIERGTYLIGDQEIYFRSKWEANYALYLEWLKKIGEIEDWIYEPLPRYEFITYENGIPRVLGLGYLPDFKVINKPNAKHPFYLVELKGYEQGMLKLKRMKKFYPDIPIEFIDKKEYAALKAKVGKMLNFY